MGSICLKGKATAGGCRSKGMLESFSSKNQAREKLGRKKENKEKKLKLLCPKRDL